MRPWIGGTVVFALIAMSAWADDSVCAEERERLFALQRTLAEHENASSARSTADAWAEVVRETCTWAGPRAPEADDWCVEVHRCARLHTEDRLVWVAPGSDAATFARVTGDAACVPDTGPTCAASAADAADARLADLMGTLQLRGDSPDVAQIAWSRYRDAACREDSLAAGADRAWTAAACRAVHTIRRTELLGRLADGGHR